MSRISWVFDEHRSWLIRFETSSPLPMYIFGLITLNVDGVSNHLSSQLHTLFPLPIFHLTPWFMIPFAAMTLLQAKHGCFPNWASRKDMLAKYLILKTLWKRESKFVCKHHPYFPRYYEIIFQNCKFLICFCLMGYL